MYKYNMPFYLIMTKYLNYNVLRDAHKQAGHHFIYFLRGVYFSGGGEEYFFVDLGGKKWKIGH